LDARLELDFKAVDGVRQVEIVLGKVQDGIVVNLGVAEKVAERLL
jgi:hypothetical protein